MYISTAFKCHWSWSNDHCCHYMEKAVLMPALSNTCPFSPLSREVMFQNIFGYYSFISIILSTALYVCQHHPCIWLLTKGFLGNSFFCASLTQPSMNLSCQLPLQWTRACWKLYYCISLSGYVCIIIETSLTYYSIFHKANNFPLHHNFCKLREAASRRSFLF